MLVRSILIAPCCYTALVLSAAETVIKHTYQQPVLEISALRAILSHAIPRRFDTALPESSVIALAGEPKKTPLKDFAAGDLVFYQPLGEACWYFGALRTITNYSDCATFSIFLPDIIHTGNPRDMLVQGKAVPGEKLRRLGDFWQRLLRPEIRTPSYKEAFIRSMHKYLENHTKDLPASIKICTIPERHGGSRIATIGDLHGDQRALNDALVWLATEKNLISATGVIAERLSLIFLGDIGDRLRLDIDCWKNILYLAELNPSNVFIIRGNHECYDLEKTGMGFKDRFSYTIGGEYWPIMQSLWEKLPLALFIGHNRRATNFWDFLMFSHGGFCMHCDIQSLLRVFIQNTKIRQETFKTDKDAACMEHYVWSDVKEVKAHEELQSTKRAAAACENVERGIGLVYNSALARGIMRKMSRIASDAKQPSVCVSCLIRAHDHSAVAHIGNIGVLSDTGIYRPLDQETLYPLSESSQVFTVTSCPHMYQEKANPMVTALAYICAHDNGSWYLRAVRIPTD